MRLFRLIATPIVLLSLLAALLWAGSWGWRNLTAPLPTPEPTPCVTQSVDVILPANVSLRVYNGGFTTGLAQRTSTFLESAGFQIVAVGNTDERIKTTIIRGNAQNEAALQLVASFFVEPAIEHDARVDGTIDVLIGSEFAGHAEAPLTELPADTGTLCVPPTPEASPVPTATATETSPPAEGE